MNDHDKIWITVYCVKCGHDIEIEAHYSLVEKMTVENIVYKYSKAVWDRRRDGWLCHDCLHEPEEA